MTTLQELEMDLNYGNFASASPVVVADAIKVEQGFKVVINELNTLISLRITVETQQLEIDKLKEDYSEMLSILNKIIVDYPEIVIEKPKLFGLTN